MRRPLLVAFALLALTACSDPQPPLVENGGSGGTAGSGGGTGATGGSGGTGGNGGAVGGSGGGGSGGTTAQGPRVNELERLGNYSPARTTALLAGVNSPLLVTGLEGVYMGDTAIFGLDRVAPDDDAQRGSGLGGRTKRDRATPAMRRLEHEIGRGERGFDQRGFGDAAERGEYRGKPHARFHRISHPGARRDAGGERRG